MSQVTIPVEGIGVTTLYLCIHGIARQTVLPEDRGLQRLKVRLIPHIRAQFTPTRTPWMEVGLIDGESLGVGLGDKLRLTGNRPHMLRVDWFTQTHIVVAPDRIAVGLVIHLTANLKVHATAHILYHQTVAARCCALEVDVPHIGAYQILTTSLLVGSGSLFPELDRSHALLLFRVDLVEPHLPTLPSLIVTLSAIAQPLVEVCSVKDFCWRIAHDVDVNGFRLCIPDVEADCNGLLVGTDALGNGNGIGTALFHRLWQLEEEPVVEFTFQRVVCIHRLGFPPDVQGLGGGEGFIVCGTDPPQTGLLSLAHLQAFAEYEKRVITLGKRVAEVGTCSCAVVSVMHFTITEMYHEVILVNHFEPDNFRGRYRGGCQE